jgi:hypothetical protein
MVSVDLLDQIAREIPGIKNWGIGILPTQSDTQGIVSQQSVLGHKGLVSHSDTDPILTWYLRDQFKNQFFA